MSPDESEPRVLVLSRPGCHLCEEAIAVVESVVAETGDSYEERNVDRAPELLRRYSEQVPVIFVDGRQHDFWRVSEDRLRQALRR